MLTPKLSPSMMCADIFKLQETLDVFREQKIEWLHMDVMDGHFVPNLAIGTDYVKMLRQRAGLPFDIHFMVQDPMALMPLFEIRAGDLVSVHAENAVHLQRTLAWIRARGAKPLVALNPATPVFVLEDVLEDVDGILVMTVNPGFAGQEMIPQSLKKIGRLRKWLDNAGYQRIMIEVDGNVSFQNAVKMRKAGADVFVCGSSSVFSGGGTLRANIMKMRGILED